MVKEITSSFTRKERDSGIKVGNIRIIELEDVEKLYLGGSYFEPNRIHNDPCGSINKEEAKKLGEYLLKFANSEV